MTPVVEFDGVSKRYRTLWRREDRWALRDFSLQVGAGEIVGFLGPNGAGKTTAIHIALGLAQPSHGGGAVLGHSFGTVNVRRRIGFLSESPAFYHQAAREVVKFSGAMNGVREPELSHRTKKLLGAVGLLEDADRNISKFSRGMLQRIGIAQALINDPELLILDEPTSALDPLSRLHVRELILQMRAEGKTVFVSSHQLSEVELVCDRVVFVQEGRVISSGATHELLHSFDQFEITASGLSTVPTTARDIRHDKNRVIFSVAGIEQREAIEQVWSAGGTVVSVTPKTQTLEDLFIRLMANPTAHSDALR